MRPTLLVSRFGAVCAPALVASAHGQHQSPELAPQCRVWCETSSLRPRDGLNASTAARAAIDAMNSQFYNASQSRWSPGDPWWLCGVALTGLVDYMRKTGSAEYMSQAKQIIQVQREPLAWWPQGDGEFRGDSTDDTGWWALAMVRMFDLTGDTAYLNISIADEAYMYDYWTDTDCGGGIYVDIRTEAYKNAIANELYIKLAASLHNRVPGDTQYLARAESAWSWFQASGMINTNNLINDGLTENDDGSCYNNKLPTWTYNQGVILGALTELYRATQDEAYLASAQTIAAAVLASTTLTRDGILTERCEPSASCNSDQEIFKGIFAANLAELDAAVAAAGNSSSGSGSSGPYRDYLEQNAESAYGYDRSSSGEEAGGDLYDVGWAGPFENSTISTQASALGLLVALI
ncbi:glycoside hydrolase family 76 protein [Trichocladium antarcticum]|uniref:Glycoside hydrolase family 76 protein n=1 Tax=Trichocladium antarcticum TaxID=1450529 RepID=A0AAN6ZG86_9PEZI|nr:glycoside hydrolase family 76 protein [Trichocladium antarcticum]